MGAQYLGPALLVARITQNPIDQAPPVIVHDLEHAGEQLAQLPVTSFRSGLCG